MTRILNIGEALIDEINRPNTAPVEVVGGSMLNVAAGLTRLGHESELATWFGRDERGAKVRAHAEEAGVTLVEGSDAAEFTTVAHATIDEKARATYEFEVLWDVPAIPDQDGVGHPEAGPVHHGGAGADAQAPYEGGGGEPQVDAEGGQRAAPSARRTHRWSSNGSRGSGRG